MAASSRRSGSKDELKFPHDLNYDKWIAIDGVPVFTEEELFFQGLGLDKNPSVIDKRITKHFSNPSLKRTAIAIVVYKTNDDATKALVELEYQLRPYYFALVISRVSELRLFLRDVELTRIEDTEVEECEGDVKYSFNPPMDKQPDNLFKLFGDTERLSEDTFRYKSYVDAITAVWGLDGQMFGSSKLEVSLRNALPLAVGDVDHPLVNEIEQPGTIKPHSNFDKSLNPLRDLLGKPCKFYSTSSKSPTKSLHQVVPTSNKSPANSPSKLTIESGSGTSDTSSTKSSSIVTIGSVGSGASCSGSTKSPSKLSVGSLGSVTSRTSSTKSPSKLSVGSLGSGTSLSPAKSPSIITIESGTSCSSTKSPSKAPVRSLGSSSSYTSPGKSPKEIEVSSTEAAAPQHTRVSEEITAERKPLLSDKSSTSDS